MRQSVEKKTADEIFTHTAVRVPKMRTYEESITGEGWLNGAVKPVILEHVTFTMLCALIDQSRRERRTVYLTTNTLSFPRLSAPTPQPHHTPISLRSIKV